MSVWPEAMGGCWPPIKPLPETPHQASIPEWDKTDDEPAKGRRVRKPIAQD